MPSRLLSTDVFAEPVPLSALPADEVVEGTPGAGAVTLAEVGGREVGVWEMTQGSARDTEVDEVFVVVAGSGSVTFADGERIALSPGVAVRLVAGESTVWVVTQRLRKIWVT